MCPAKVEGARLSQWFVSDANCKGMRVGGHYVAAGERQQTPCQCWRRSNTADVTAASFGAGCCTQSYPSTLALSSAIGKSCDSAGLNTGPSGSSGPGADEIRPGHHEDRQSTRPYDPAVATRAG